MAFVGAGSGRGKTHGNIEAINIGDVEEVEHTSIEPVELTGQRRGTQLQNQRWVAPASNNERRNWVAPAKAVDTDSNSGLNRNPNIDTDGGNQARKGKELKPVCAPDSNPITMLVTVCVEQKK
nr:hypothetical protein Iba_chr13aCG12050 [Ipomoea batatas]